MGWWEGGSTGREGRWEEGSIGREGGSSGREAPVGGREEEAIDGRAQPWCVCVSHESTEVVDSH